MRIAIVVKSTGVEYDDRVRKVALALSKDASVKIYIVQDDNTASVGKTSYGVDYESIKLTTRDVLPRASFLLVKSFEFYFRLARKLKKYDAVWYNEEKTFLFPLLAPKSQVFIWDNHELPMSFVKGWRRELFWIIEKKAKKMIHANPQRIEYLKEIGLLKHPEKHTFIHNYPDEFFVNSKDTPPNYDIFIEWLGNDKYVYVQGLNAIQRRPYNTIASVLEMTSHKIVVVGKVDPVELSELEKKYQDLRDRAFFYGMVPQLSIPELLKHAEFSIVLYDTQKPNNKYCEANRMYQAMALGVPVIVGCNPSMKEVVEGKYGIALRSDGRDLNEIFDAVQLLNANIGFYRTNCKENAKTYIWSDDDVNINWFN